MRTLSHSQHLGETIVFQLCGTLPFEEEEGDFLAEDFFEKEGDSLEDEGDFVEDDFFVFEEEGDFLEDDFAEEEGVLSSVSDEVNKSDNPDTAEESDGTVVTSTTSTRGAESLSWSEFGGSSSTFGGDSGWSASWSEFGGSASWSEFVGSASWSEFGGSGDSEFEGSGEGSSSSSGE